jgi:hypothetical protein
VVALPEASQRLTYSMWAYVCVSACVLLPGCRGDGCAAQVERLRSGEQRDADVACDNAGGGGAGLEGEETTSSSLSSAEQWAINISFVANLVLFGGKVVASILTGTTSTCHH